MIQIILAILAIILVIYGICLAIGAIFTTLAWVSSNVLLFIEKCFFISNVIPPWVSWGIFGLIIGLVVAAYKEAPRYGKAHLRPLLVVFQIGLIGGLCLYNMNRLQGAREATSEIQSYQPKTSTREQSAPNQKGSGLSQPPYQGLPYPQRYVDDRVNIISDAVEKDINGYLRELEQKTGTQMIVLTINTTGGIPIETYAIERATKWKLGQKGNGNGVLIIIAKDDRAYRIEIGRGLEKILPDSFCGTVGKTYFVPAFQRGQFSEGIYQGVVILVNKIAEESGIKINGMPSMADMRKKANERQQPSSQEAGNNCFASVSPDRWKGEYYNNGNLRGSPSMVRDDGSDFINFAWGDFSPWQYCGISKDYFSVRWTRTVNFAKGTYRFTATIRDVRLYIDDIMKLEEGFIEPRTYTVDVPLTEGKHTIKMKYRESSINGIVKLAWQVLPTSEQSTAQSPITYNLNGEWEGKVDNKPVKLSIAQDGNSLSGNIVYDTEFSKTNVKEHLSGEINNDKIVLKGTGYTAKGVTSFSLDTFSGTISSQDGDFIRGNYTDEAGNEGSWSVKRVLVASYPDINNANTDVHTQSKIGEENTGRELSNNNRRDGTNRISSFFSTLQDSNRNHSTKRDSSVKVERYTTTRRYQLFDKEKKVSKPRTETRVRKQTEKKPKKSKKSKKKNK